MFSKIVGGRDVSNGKVDFPLLYNNRDGAITTVAATIVGTRGVGQLLGLEFKGWKGVAQFGPRGES